MIKQSKRLLQITLLSTMISSSVVFANDEVKNIKNISKELVKVRADIEKLHSEISLKKENFKDQVRSYSIQKSDLEAKINRNELRVKELERELNNILVENKKKSSAQNRLTPVLLESIASVKEYLNTTIPFKKEQRINALNNLETKIKTGIVTPNKGANQLWAFIEDELMLGKTNGIYNESLNIDGTEKLAKVVKLGKVALFYKTNDEEYGKIYKKDNTWSIEKISNPETIASVATLFDALTKQIRTAKFTIPNVLPKVEK